MYDALSSPNIYSIKTLNEFSNVMIEHPNAIIWAGGTSIMSSEDFYPSKKNNMDIAYLGEVEELKRQQRNDRLIEYGAMTNIFDVFEANRSNLPSILEKNISSFSSTLITKRATIGGSICKKDIITSIPGTLMVLNASVEIRYLKRKRIHSKWIPLSHTIEKGRITLPPRSLLSRVRIAIPGPETQEFYSIGSPMLNTEECVIMAFASDWNQNVLINPHMAITFPSHGIIYSRDLDNVFSSLQFPLDREEYSSVESILLSIQQETFPSISNLQKARVQGMLEKLIDTLNKKILEFRQENEMERI